MLLVAFVLAPGTLAQESDLIEGARRATGYWNSRYATCGGPGQAKVWYATAEGGAVQLVTDLRVQFKTEKISREERLNGVEFKATTELEPGPSRWWNPKTKTWAYWTDQPVAPPAALMKKKGVWTVQFNDERKPIAACSQAPAGGI